MRAKKILVKILVKTRIRKIIKTYNSKISNLVLNKSYLNKNEIIKIHKKKWEKLLERKVSPNWCHFFTEISGIVSSNFVPESVFYSIIEPILNDNEFYKSYADKNFYDLIYPTSLFPDVVLRNIDSSFLDKDYEAVELDDDKMLFEFLKKNDKIIVKPSLESWGGKNIKIFSLQGDVFVDSTGKVLTLRYLEGYYKNNYVIQKLLQPHLFLGQFNNSSINTVRLLTYRNPYTNRVKVLHAFLRVGLKGHEVDNASAGGFIIGINSSGRLYPYAIKENGSKYVKVNDIGLNENKYVMPFFKEIKELGISIAQRNIHHRLLGLDLTIDSRSDIRCIEINNYRIGINACQMLYGPFFGESTDEIIRYCTNNKDKLYKRYYI